MVDIEKEHEEVRRSILSPEALDYIEDFYRHKMTSGRLSYQQVREKINNIAGFDDYIKEHILRHIGPRPVREEKEVYEKPKVSREEEEEKVEVKPAVTISRKGKGIRIRAGERVVTRVRVRIDILGRIKNAVKSLVNRLLRRRRR